MKIGADTVRHVAKLAELDVADTDVSLLASQLESIVAFVEQLAEVECPDDTTITLGPAQVALREDVVRPIPLARGPAEIASAFEQGFFVVPRLGGMVDE